jgi:hypothetical protein
VAEVLGELPSGTTEKMLNDFLIGFEKYFDGVITASVLNINNLEMVLFWDK